MIGVVGDLHIGASLKAGGYDAVTGTYSRLIDYENTLLFTIKDLADKGVKTLVFTGDIFEHRHPSMSQQKIFSHALQYAVELGIQQIYIIIGNHDQQRIKNTTTLAYLSELKLGNIIVVDEISAFKCGSDTLYFVPYRDRKQLQVPSYDEAITLMRKQLSDVREAQQASGLHILIGHMAIEGTFFAEEDTELYTDNDLMLPKDMFLQFDVSLMGHVHTPGQISATPPIYYVGSMEKRAAHESHDKQYVIVQPSTKVIQWFKEPCKDFWEIDLNMTDEVYGPTLMTNLVQRMTTALHGLSVKDNILKVLLKIMIDDIGYLNIDEIKATLSKYSPSFVYPIIPSCISLRATTKVVVESSSDADTWTNYCKSLPQNLFSPEIIKFGLEIITEGSE